jgi:3-oxoacyl-[acyl-carrier-protein] synthase II
MPVNKRRVVVTGLGVVAPNGIGRDAFWQNLIDGKSAVDYVRAFDASSHACKVAAEVKEFRPPDFISSRKARMMARFSQFGVAATRLALEDARLSITPSLSQHVAICFGTSVAGLELAVAGVYDFVNKGAGVIKPWTALEYPPHAAASYLSIEFGITGPALSISSNCCTGIDSIHTAASLIANKRAKVALAGACDTPIFPAIFDSFCTLGALTKRNHAPQQASRPYDRLRDGLVLAEGAATLVLEDLEFALRREADIYAEVLGYGGASEATGMREGDLSGQVMAQAISAAIIDADLNPVDIDCINAHGSSLQDFDICDSNSFKHALGIHAYRIPVTSIKSMIGQPVSAAGVLQAAAACLSIRHQLVPPTINQEFPDPECDLDYVPNKSRVARIRYALINGHSFGGSVAALVLGRYQT